MSEALVATVDLPRKGEPASVDTLTSVHGWPVGNVYLVAYLYCIVGGKKTVTFPSCAAFCKNGNACSFRLTENGN